MPNTLNRTPGSPAGNNSCRTGTGLFHRWLRRKMIKLFIVSLTMVVLIASKPTLPAALSDIRTVPQDLEVPSMQEAQPAPGKRVKMTIPSYQNTDVYHSLYLPEGWKKGNRYPVIVEYAGNGPYHNKYGDTCSGRVEDCNLGYGISGGKGVIWVCLPYISMDHRNNQLKWWGDIEATVGYCTTLLPRICNEYGGDPGNLFLAGFSRGSIACNFIGLHNDEIAKLWKGFICHSHYDGVIKWQYSGSDSISAAARLARLKSRPQFISHEGSVAATQRYLEKACPKGNFRFLELPYRNHTDSWVLRDIPERRALREWFAGMTARNNQQDGQQRTER